MCAPWIEARAPIRAPESRAWRLRAPVLSVLGPTVGSMTTPARYLVGTERKHTVKGQGVGRGSGVQRADRIVDMPTGLRHAVAEGTTSSLCPQAPQLLVWPTLEFSDASGGRDECPACRALWDSRH